MAAKDADTERRRCAYVIESKAREDGKVRGGRPMWRRSCKRWAQAGGRYCWQHNDGPEPVGMVPPADPGQPTQYDGPECAHG